MSIEISESLDEYRRFHHVVRNVYGFDLDVTRIEPLIERSRGIFIQLQRELLKFAYLLDQIAD